MQACKLMRSRSISKFFRYQSLSGIKFAYIFFTTRVGMRGMRAMREMRGMRAMREMRGMREMRKNK
ncbi:hypothetical protein [Nostoc sp.]|uniref:hypothetical protein n=1 Tax=Nostoc sp. TaxID=1180 RepID=UPI002FF6484C